MGDLNAVDLAEEMHIGVLQDSGGMQAQHTMTYPNPLPYNLDGFFEGVMIDDHVGIQVVRSSSDPTPAVQGLPRSHMDGVFDAAAENYTRVGLKAHEKKRKRNQSHAEFWEENLRGERPCTGPHGER